MRLALAFAFLVVGTFSNVSSYSVLGFVGVAPAYAGCKPKCAKGQQCRYEAAGGKFYCEDLPSDDAVGVRKPSGTGRLPTPGQVQGSGISN